MAIDKTSRPISKRSTRIERKRRCVMASDTEWAAITADAKQADLSISAYIRQRLAQDIPPPPHLHSSDADFPELSPELKFDALVATLHQYKVLKDRYYDADRLDDFRQDKQEIETFLSGRLKL